MKTQRIFLFLALVLCGSFGMSIARASASTVTLVPSSGGDTTLGAAVFSASDLNKLSASDDVRVSSNTDWMSGSSYDEAGYLEFSFSPTIPDGATITSVSITNEFRRTGALTAAKLEVWNGTQFVDFPVTVGTINVDHTDTVDASSVVSTLSQVRGLRVRFLAYRDTQGSTKTSHDYVAVTIGYTETQVTNTPPVATDLNLSQTVDNPTLITLSGTDAESNPLTYIVVAQPTKGVLSSVTNNHITYTPTGALGVDTFTYKVNDGTADSTIATVTITLTPGITNTLVVTPSSIVVPISDTDTLVIRSQDKFGNFTTSDNSTVITTSATTGGILSSASFTLNNGMATDFASTTSSGVVSFNFYANGATTPSGFTTLAFTPTPAPLGGSDTTTVHIACESASDTTGTGVPLALRPFADIPFIAVEDTLNYPSWHYWPTNGAYNEINYIECIGDTNKIPSDAVIDAVLFKHTFARPSYPIIGAKIEIWNGSQFVDFALTPPTPTSGVLSQTIDITNVLNTPTLVNTPKWRLLLYGTSVENAVQIATDMMGMDVLYHASTNTTQSGNTQSSQDTNTNTNSNNNTNNTNTDTNTNTNTAGTTSTDTQVSANNSVTVFNGGRPPEIVATPVATIVEPLRPVATEPVIATTTAVASVPDIVTSDSSVKLNQAIITPIVSAPIPLVAYAGGTNFFVKGSGYLLAGILIGLFLLRLYGFLYKDKEEDEEKTNVLEE